MQQNQLKTAVEETKLRLLSLASSHRGVASILVDGWACRKEMGYLWYYISLLLSNAV